MNINFIFPIINIFYVLLCDILYTISIFKNSFQNFTIKYKFIILIANIRIDLSQINLDIYEYKLNLNTKLFIIPEFVLSLLPGIFLLNTYIYTAFINIAIKTKLTSKVIVK